MISKKDEFEEYLDSICDRNPKTGSILNIRVPELNGKLVSTFNFSKELKKIGLTRKEWVNMHRYGNRYYNPICPYCNIRPLKFKIWGYRTSCCCRECMNKQISEQNTSEEFRRKVSRSVKNLWKDEEYRQLQSKSHKECWENEDTANRLLENHYYPSRRGTRSKIYSIYENRDINFDSNWERWFYFFMSNKKDVKLILRNVKFIKYFDSETNLIKRYKPDFLIEYLNGDKEIIEIKPLRLVNSTNVLDKKLGAEKFCMENNIRYRIITEVEFQDMGLFDDNFKLKDEYNF